MLMSFRQHQRQRAPTVSAKNAGNFGGVEWERKKKPTTFLGPTKRTRNSNYKAG